MSISKTPDFFHFAKEIYDSKTEKFGIDNLVKEKDRLDTYIKDTTTAIQNEENPDKKYLEAVSFNKTMRHAAREISMTKTAIAKRHVKDLQDALSDIGKDIKEVSDEVNLSVVDDLQEAGRADLATTFIVAPKITIRTCPIADPAKVQTVLDFLAKQGIAADVYVNDKKATDKNSWLGTSKKSEKKEKEEPEL